VPGLLETKLSAGERKGVCARSKALRRAPFPALNAVFRFRCHPKQLVHLRLNPSTSTA
jgi:hypothetical protein